jgi:uncharacterized protein DUF4440
MDADLAAIEDIERARVRALVAGDLESAGDVHADDFQLINPMGAALSKDEYLGRIQAGELRYEYWRPEEISVRMHGDAAVLRYRSQVQVRIRGTVLPEQRLWHTDVYERRGGRWQAVWSQATEMRDSLGA